MSAVKRHLLVMVGLWSMLSLGAPAHRPANATGARLVADVVVFSGAVKLRDSEKKDFAVGDHMPVALSDVLLVPPEGFVVLRIRENEQVVRIDDDVELPVQQLAVLHAGAPGRSMTEQLEALLTTSEKTQLKERMMGWMSAPLAASTPGSLGREEERSERSPPGGGAKEDAVSAEPGSPAHLPRTKERKREPSAEQPPGAAREKALERDQASEAPRPAAHVQPSPEPAKPSPRGQGPASPPPPVEPAPAPSQPSAPPPPAPPQVARPSAQPPASPPAETQGSAAAPPAAQRTKTAQDAHRSSTDGYGQPPAKSGALTCEAPRPDERLRACLAAQATALGLKGDALKLRYAFEASGALHLVLERGVPVPACVAQWFAGRPSCAADRGAWRTLLVPLK